MNLFKVDIWVKDTDFKTHVAVAETNKLAIERVLNVIEENEIIGVTAKEITKIDGHKIIIQ